MSQTDLPIERSRPKRPLSIGAGALVVHEQRVLLVRSTYGVTKGRYLLPAGRVNLDELPDQAAARETFEETSLRVEIEGLMGVRLWVMDDGEHNYFFMFRARLLSPWQHHRRRQRKSLHRHQQPHESLRPQRAALRLDSGRSRPGPPHVAPQ